LADDWRDHRNDLRDEGAALRLLQADLVKDTSEIRRAITPASRHEQSVYWLVHRWDDPALPVDSVESALRTFMFYNSYQLQTAAFTSLKQAGRLDLIQNDTLRAEIVQYFEEAQVNVDQFLTVLGENYAALWEHLAPYVRFPKPSVPGTAWPVDGAPRLTSAWESVTSDNLLAYRVSALGSVATLARRAGESAIARNLELQAAIQMELANR
jgi:hypothetical protein